jgi:hypothetical protein
MKKIFLKLAAVLSITAGLSACSNDPNVVVDPTSFLLRVIHASADAPNVDVLVDGTTVVSDLAFKEASARRNIVDARTASVEVFARVPGGTASVIGPADITFEDGVTYNVIAVGKVADATLAPLSWLTQLPASRPARSVFR